MNDEAHAEKLLADGVRWIQSDDGTQQQRSSFSFNCRRQRRAAALAEVPDDIRAAVEVDGPDLDAVVGGVPDALLARWVAPGKGDVQALA